MQTVDIDSTTLGRELRRRLLLRPRERDRLPTSLHRVSCRHDDSFTNDSPGERMADVGNLRQCGQAGGLRSGEQPASRESRRNQGTGACRCSSTERRRQGQRPGRSQRLIHADVIGTGFFTIERCGASCSNTAHGLDCYTLSKFDGWYGRTARRRPRRRQPHLTEPQPLQLTIPNRHSERSASAFMKERGNSTLLGAPTKKGATWDGV